MIWIQGTYAFVRETLDLIKVSDRYNSKTNFILLEGGEIPRSKISGATLRHARLGGLTAGRWFVRSEGFQSGFSFSPGNESLPRRTLGKILKETEKGISVGPLALSMSNSRKRGRDELPVYTESDLAPPGIVKFQVLCKSVFARSNLVKRWITDSELLDIYDVQVSVGKSILSHGDRKALMLRVVNAAPEKLSLSVARNVLAGSLGLSDSTASEKITNPSPVSRKGVQWMQEEPAMSLNDEKAARNDDIPPDIEQWDSYIINHFDPVEDGRLTKHLHPNCFECKVGKPLICVGGSTTPEHVRIFRWLRWHLFHRSCVNVMNSFLNYARGKHGTDWYLRYREYSSNSKRSKKRKFQQASSEQIQDLIVDVDVARDGIRRWCNSNWWDWSEGSTLLYWRWHPEFIKDARDGTPVHVTGTFPPYKTRQQWPKDPVHFEKCKEKVLKVIERGYIASGPVASLTGFFAVPKGESDIRMVYDATKCGLNKVLWAPTFWLPTIDTTLRQTDIGAFMADLDLGEMFLNFPLDERLRKFVGIDCSILEDDIEALMNDLKEKVRGIKSKKKRRRIFLRWTRCLMGLRPSPYLAVKAFYWAAEFIFGDLSDELNPFRVHAIRTNLPGSEFYDPSLPPLYKWDEEKQQFSCHFEIYIDDGRVSGSNFKDCVRATRQLASRCNYLGIQDAPRKRRFPSMTPSVWSGAKSLSTSDALFVTTTQAKWDKGKALIAGWKEEMKRNNNMIDYKNLESGRGFLVHIGRTYPIFVPYLKGIHNLIDSWRVGRDSDGWKISDKEWRMLLDEVDETFMDKKDKEGSWKDWRRSYRDLFQSENHPKLLDATKVKRFETDLNAIESIFSLEKPPRRLVRGRNIFVVRYGFGDAAGSGFGATWEDETRNIRFRFGIWGSDADGKSSNYRELRNIVESLESAGKQGELSGVELYFFTDNSTAERAFYKGTSTTPLLHELVFRLRNLEQVGGCKIILCHVAGTRMIAQGTDGLSRGNLSEGVMRGKLMSLFVPLHLTCVERSDDVLDWFRSWVDVPDDNMPFEILTPDTWFSRGHDHVVGDSVTNCDGRWMPKLKPGVLGWFPAPALALVAVEEIRKARVKRASSVHVFVCPRLLEPMWKKQLYRSADFVFEIPAKTSFWTSDMHEPLVVGIYFPYLAHRPWELKNSPSLVELGKRLSALWKEDEESASLVFHVADATTDAGAVWKRKKDDGRFMYARDGDMWSVPFQCECCWIVNIKGREFDPFDAKDLLLQQYLVRMNLDLMWSREPGTVKATLYQLEKGARLSEELGLDPVEISRGPWPLTDNVGCQVALQILRASQGKGKHSSEYQQFETIRKLRSGYSNAFESSPSGAIQGNVVFRAERARTYGLRACPTESIFFDRFMQGLLSRMGRVIIPDEAIDNIHMHGIIRLMNDEIHLDETTWVRKREIIMQGAYFMLCYGCSLRGYEGLYLESSDFTNFIDTGKDGVVEADGTERCEGHVCAPLLGRFKNEAGEQKHVMVMVNESSSGLRFRLWMERLAYVLKREGKNKVAGPAFCHEDGSMIMSYEMNEALLFWLEKLKFEKPRSFPEGADLGALYGVNRSFRRGANSRATEQGVGKDLRDLINRWSTFESKKGQRPNMSMAQHYLEIKLVIKRTLKYSKAL